MKSYCMCSACGYLEVPDPRDFEICPSCGFQFDVSDGDRGHTYESWRKAWISAGMPWRTSMPPPSDWHPVDQLKRIGVFPPY